MTTTRGVFQDAGLQRRCTDDRQDCAIRNQPGSAGANGAHEAGQVVPPITLIQTSGSADRNDRIAAFKREEGSR